MGLFSKEKGDKALEKMGLRQEESGTAGEEENAEASEKVVLIPTDRIVPNPAQPRRNFDEENLNTLATSIKDRGILQPVMVRKAQTRVGGRDYQLIAGERRLRAAKLAGLQKIPAIVRTVEDDEMRRLALVENLQREDLNVAERTRAIAEFVEEAGDIMSVTKELGLSERSIQRYLRIYKVIYSDKALTSLFERQAANVDFRTADLLAKHAESILSSGMLRELLDKANDLGIKEALRFIIKALSKNKKSADLYSIVVRENTLVFTVRHPADVGLKPEDKRRIQKGLRQFFSRLAGNEK